MLLIIIKKRQTKNIIKKKATIKITSFLLIFIALSSYCSFPYKYCIVANTLESQSGSLAYLVFMPDKVGPL